MRIIFKTKKLETCYTSNAEADRAWGQVVGRKYIQRLDIIRAANTLEDLKKLRPLRCHPLKGDRAGQWAINLTGFYRLIFTLQGDQLEIVCIEEVSKHYDD